LIYRVLPEKNMQCFVHLRVGVIEYPGFFGKDFTRLILQGAVPAALLELLVQGVFELIERRLSP